MRRRRVNYDDIACAYNRRFDERHDLRGIAQELRTLAQELSANRILEVGCGTGRWLADLRQITGELFGLDLSAGMLSQARQRDAQLQLVRGEANALPFPSKSFDLIYCVNALHHFDRGKEFICEARRLLLPDGALAVIGMNPRRGAHLWYIYQYFEAAYEADLARFPSWGKVLDWMETAGFRQGEWRTVERIYNPLVGQAVFADPFLEKGSTSQLILLSDEAYAAGLERIRQEIATAESRGKTVVFPVDIQIDLLVGYQTTSPTRLIPGVKWEG